MLVICSVLDHPVVSVKILPILKTLTPFKRGKKSYFNQFLDPCFSLKPRSIHLPQAMAQVPSIGSLPVIVLMPSTW